MNWAWGWPAVEAIATGVATLTVIGGIVFVFRQIREARKSTNAQISVELFEKLRSDQTLEIVRYIYNLPPQVDSKYSIAKHRYDIENVTGRLDFLGLLVHEDIVDTKLAVEGYAGVTALRCWYQLYQYIWEVRAERKYFCDNFEAFTNQCCQYFKDKCIKVGFTNPYITTPIDDLVKLLLDSKEENDPSKKKLYPRSISEIGRCRKCKKQKRVEERLRLFYKNLPPRGRGTLPKKD